MKMNPIVEYMLKHDCSLYRIAKIAGLSYATIHKLANISDNKSVGEFKLKTLLHISDKTKIDLISWYEHGADE